MASRLYGYFKMCWENETITIEQLENAVLKGYITQEELQTIIAE